MVLYALIANASVAALFLGGVVPGPADRRGDDGGGGDHRAAAQLSDRAAGAALRERPRILARAILPLGMPVVLLGGIYGGAFTPTEAAAVAALYALVLAGVRLPRARPRSAVRGVPRDRPAERA